ncbi:hypothetical protein GLOIN_2v1719392 [Rhizophagus clarus]|uniref:Uncharacterized protein n=1 Tax=Rhizophagus clarus TaxID=94130 RepID=A0A8H3QKR1_9GLOM|nr:hypothetical protein GLOIN_2v1719392 [Rhizophagus clarus]
MSQKKRPKENRTRTVIRDGLLVQKDKDFLSTSASKFNPIDLEALRVNFVPSTEDNVIPSFEGTVTDLPDFPENYLLPKLRRRFLERHDFDVEKVKSITDKSVRTFVDKLHDTVQNGLLALETSETYTDTLMIHLLVRVVGFDDWPLKLKIHPPYNLYIEDEATVFAEPEFVIDNNKISVITVEFCG